MSRVTRWVCAVLLAGAAPVAAQVTQAMPAAVDAVPAERRFQLRIMEGVLENAVEQGAQRVSTQMRRVSPDIALFSGPARARGFRLEGYGAFFAVDVPALHRSVTWSVRTLTQSNADLSRALQAIRRMVSAQHDARLKTELEQSLKLLELQVGPSYARPAITNATVAATAVSADAPQAAAAPEHELDAAAAAAALPIMANPSGAYTDSVQREIVEAMINYGATLNLSPEEWLTVAARENTETVIAGDLAETVTITLRVKAADLDALKTGRITRDELRRRVDVREF